MPSHDNNRASGIDLLQILPLGTTAVTLIYYLLGLFCLCDNGYNFNVLSLWYLNICFNAIDNPASMYCTFNPMRNNHVLFKGNLICSMFRVLEVDVL